MFLQYNTDVMLLMFMANHVRLNSGGPFKFDCTVLNGFALLEHNNGT